MKMRHGKVLPFLIIAFILTLAFVVYMRMAGPNHPHRFRVAFSDTEYKLKLPKTATTDTPLELRFHLANDQVDARVYYRLYPGERPWQMIPMEREGADLLAYLPVLPTAGKYAYFVEFEHDGNVQTVRKDDPMVVRYNHPVPDAILLAHVLSMVVASFMGIMVLLLTIRRHRAFRKYTLLTFAFLTLGGMILGPIVQKYAFGEYWTGFPFGMDLTDNKTLIVWIAFLYAVIRNWKKEQPLPALIASILFIAINLIPHSMFGSELNPETGEIIQG